jgi:thiamine biosynthesis lipoprotein ApbE
MKRFFFIVCALCLFALLAGAERSRARSEQTFVFHHENVLGTSLELKITAPSLAAAEKAEAAALAEIDRDAKILSAYDPASEFSRWLNSGHRPTPVSPELFEVLNLFQQWHDRSGGALDAAAETIGRVWKTAAQQQRLPAPGELEAAVQAVRQPHWRLDPVHRTATRLSDAPLALNSFAKSYIVNRASEAALAAANPSALVVNIGGDLVVRGALTEAVNIADPQADAENRDPVARVLVRNRAVATSGSYRRGVQIGGRWYSHIVDPRTGQPVDHVISATVVAPQATDAGALATTFNVLTPSESLQLAASMPGVECLLITREGQQLMSPGWRALAAPLPPANRNPAATVTAQGWDPSYELVINLELARIAEQRTRRPFVAVWVEDKDKFPVRTVALWFDKARWLPELRGWYHGDRLRNMAEGSDITSTVSSATRSPGKYTLVWDGKDNKGKYVKPGKYTVFIEAAREHGTYQLIRQEMDFSGTPKQITLPGNVEITSASLDYHKRTNH